MKIFRIIFFISVMSALTSACVSNDYHKLSEREQAPDSAELPTPPEIQHTLFKKEVINTDDIFALTSSQRKRFLSYFNAHQNQSVRPHVRVAKYIQEFSTGFNFQGDTLTAKEAFEQRTGNCLSLAILSTAYVKEAGLRFQYNRINSAPTYQEYENVQLVSTHVNLTIIDVQQTTGDIWLSNAITIDYFRTKDSYISKVVSPDELMVMYWNNLASEAIIGGKLDIAFAYALQANAIDPLYPETLNLLAILYNRKGHAEYAYTVYDFMDKNNLVSFSAIDNFATMLVNSGDTKRAALLRSKIQHIIDDNPYTWLSRGIAQFEKGEYKLAESYLLKSSSYGPYLHEPLYNLAKIYVKQNRFKAARNALEKAKELAYVADDERRYQAKIYSLNE